MALKRLGSTNTPVYLVEIYLHNLADSDGYYNCEPFIVPQLCLLFVAESC